MGQYQKALEKEFERFLINENYQEHGRDNLESKADEKLQLQKRLEEDICWEMFKDKYFNNKGRDKLKVSDYEYFRYFDGDSLVDKVEKVLAEMREDKEYFSLDKEGYVHLGDDCLDGGDDYPEIEQDANYRDGEGII